MTAVFIVLFALLVGAAIAVFWITQLYNGLVAARGEVDRSWANIDVLLKQRHDELPKLVEVCKAYMAHERQTLEAVVAARTRFAATRTTGEQAQASVEVSSALRHLFAVAEGYPQLRAMESFQQLQARISDLEGQIADRREMYNAAANSWNVRIEQVPEALLARPLAMRARELWHAEPADRADVKLGLALT